MADNLNIAPPPRQGGRHMENVIPHVLLGVPGKLHQLLDPAGRLYQVQCWRSDLRPVNYYNFKCQIQARLSFDTSFCPGVQTLRVYAELRGPRNARLAVGLLHTELDHAFPELRPVLPWHLCSTSGPRGYPDEVLQHLNDPAKARTLAHWPLMTDAHRALPSAELRTLLQSRKPMLMLEFANLMEDCGLQWRA